MLGSITGSKLDLIILVIQIAGGILLALVVLKEAVWIAHKVKERIAQEKYVNMLAAQMRADREEEGEWLRATRTRYPQKTD